MGIRQMKKLTIVSLDADAQTPPDIWDKYLDKRTAPIRPTWLPTCPTPSR
jgi:hypothetical protein